MLLIAESAASAFRIVAFRIHPSLGHLAGIGCWPAFPQSVFPVTEFSATFSAFRLPLPSCRRYWRRFSVQFWSRSRTILVYFHAFFRRWKSEQVSHKFFTQREAHFTTNHAHFNGFRHHLAALVISQHSVSYKDTWQAIARKIFKLSCRSIFRSQITSVNYFHST